MMYSIMGYVKEKPSNLAGTIFLPPPLWISSAVSTENVLQPSCSSEDASQHPCSATDSAQSSFLAEDVALIPGAAKSSAFLPCFTSDVTMQGSASDIASGPEGL